MNFGKNPRIRVSKRKIEKTEMALDKTISSVLPKEMPLEKYILKMFLSTFYLILHVHYWNMLYKSEV